MILIKKYLTIWNSFPEEIKEALTKSTFSLAFMILINEFVDGNHLFLTIRGIT